MKYFFYTMLFGMTLVQEVSAQCRTRDSLILVDLYNATNGTSWTNRTNWLSANPINTWYGIKLKAGGCVDSISLAAAGLKGNIPISFQRMDSLRYLSIASNKIDSLPNLSNLVALQALFAANNKLTFDDLLPNLNALQRGSFSPQDSVGNEGTFIRYVGQSLTLTLGIDAAITTNTYNWYFISLFIL